jgi:CPA1 family monovalent cation:H+ antiporter
MAFVLIGLQLRLVLVDVGRLPIAELLGGCVIVCGTTLLVRFGWMIAWNDLPRALDRSREKQRHNPWQHSVLITWAGMRGVDSLAAALAVPLVLADGVTPFPQRSLILFLSFSVILTTLVVQGLTLPALIRRLALPPDVVARREELQLRLAAAAAALRRLEELVHGAELPPAAVDNYRAALQNRIRHYESRLAHSDHEPIVSCAETAHELMLEILHAERQAVADLKAQGKVGDEAVRRVERSLDYEELTLGSEENRLRDER